MVLMTSEADDLRRQRRRARVTQLEIALQLGISDAAVSLYEAGVRSLPFDLTGDDYSAAMDAILAERQAS